MVIKLALTYRPRPASQNIAQGHLSDGALEEYSLDSQPESSLCAVEEHLLVCGQCRGRLDGIEPVNYIHFTDDGPVYARATRLTTGKAMARQWDPDLHAGKAFGSVSAAGEYLAESFFQMYPEHTCNRLCGSPQLRLPAPT